MENDDFCCRETRKNRWNTAMLAENDAAELHADVLKVGHHGSKNSTMPDFLAAVAPSVSIIRREKIILTGIPTRNCWKD